MKKFALLMLSVYLLAGCNTINGIGKDKLLQILFNHHDAIYRS
jgi:uncharacterized protein YcfL